MLFNERNLTNNTFWYYDKETGLYYNNRNFVGIGYTFSQIEELSEAK